MKKAFLSFILFLIQFLNAQEKGLKIDFINILEDQERSTGNHIYLGYSDMIFSQNFYEQEFTEDSIVVLLVDKISNDSTYHYFDSGSAILLCRWKYFCNKFYGNYYNTQWLDNDKIMTNMFASDLSSNQVLVTLVFDLEIYFPLL